MSMTYADANTETRTEDAFVPRYARPTKSKKSVKTWMILAPIGAVVPVSYTHLRAHET